LPSNKEDGEKYAQVKQSLAKKNLKI